VSSPRNSWRRFASKNSTNLVLCGVWAVLAASQWMSLVTGEAADENRVTMRAILTGVSTVAFAYFFVTVILRLRQFKAGRVDSNAER
jgi:hypothetical protein